MIADIGNRRGAQLEEVDCIFYCFNGLTWMRMKTQDFPMKTVMEISLKSEELDQFKHKVPSNK